MELGWGGFDRAKLDMLMLIRIPFSFHVTQDITNIIIQVHLLHIILIQHIICVHNMDAETSTVNSLPTIDAYTRP